ncbi:2OG-Fe(II) oxygenase [Pseudomonas sp. BT-42-2]|jgi:SM-20-related protein|uniref:2OG-Fe(II) oxygenase n=1 Tax=Pseudomonas TaxID=286 RepID=UPI0021F71F19|nr:2OG-Fe(II) oxygenase [Pseudomonas sp. BT-42-2]MCV9920629.1 2OG-Fe(II) oxygenase [Pseudomonas sp. BT-42-2]
MSGVIAYRDICVIDEGISAEDHAQLHQKLSESIWRYGWPYPYGPLERPSWHSFIAGSRRNELEDCEQELRERPGWGFLADFWARIKAAHMPNATLLGVYANGQTSAQDGPIHRDNTPEEPGQSVIVFCNDHWASCWGGELVFYDDDKDSIVMTVQPKPRRVVVMNGEVPHAARAPAASCNRLRMSVAFKTIIKER